MKDFSPVTPAHYYTLRHQSPTQCCRKSSNVLDCNQYDTIVTGPQNFPSAPYCCLKQPLLLASWPASNLNHSPDKVLQLPLEL